MSLSDPYKELELYLEQVENEITHAFENGDGAPTGKPRPPPRTVSKLTKTKLIENELDGFLNRFNETINSDLAELLSRRNNLNCDDDNDSGKDGDDLKWNILESDGRIHDDLILETDILCDSPGAESMENFVALPEERPPIDAATQTSPSLSPSSTNLTCASECSSSPSLWSSSDGEVLEDDDDRKLFSNFRKEGHTWGGGEYLDKWSQVLSGKSSSAPLLEKVPVKVKTQTRSQSDRHLAEIEAAEACSKWLRATGFPQYAQMYEDLQFPVDMSTVAQDHPLLEQDVLQSLFRRLQILNNCAHCHQQRVTHANTDESEDENCALSDNWTYQKDIRRWSRTCTNMQIPEDLSARFHSQEKDDVFKKSTQSPKERLKRAGSIKFKRRREGVILSDSDPRILDNIPPETRLDELKWSQVSDSEITHKQTTRSRTKSFDLHQPSEDRILLPHLPLKSEYFSDRETLNQDYCGPPLSSLSCTQLQVLKKLALLKLTAHMEKYCPSHRTGWNWDLPKLIRKIKTPTHKDKIVFGVPISLILQKTGKPLPKNIEEAMIFLEKHAHDQVGLFRKSGVKSRIQAIRNLVESSTEILSFNEQQCYDVADMVKQYFRELPETLLTNKLSETFMLIFQYVPPYLRRESVFCAILLMPDEHVQVLETLLAFLLSVVKHSASNQMNENNLAVCLAPSIFYHSQISLKQNSGSPQAKELAETRAGHDCLYYLLKHYHTLFKVPKEFVNQCKTSEFKESQAVKLTELGKNMGGWREYLNECQTALLREVKDKTRGWISVPSYQQKVEVSFKKVADGHPLRLWKICVEVEAPPTEILHRIIRERHVWDSELHSAKIVSQIEKNCEVFQFVRLNIGPLPNEEYCILRTWKTDHSRDACSIVETSIDHQDAVPSPNTVRGIVLASRYLIEPCGSGKSRLVHLSRVDVMGKSPDWYQKNYGHLCALFVSNIASSFSQTTVGPESKV